MTAFPSRGHSIRSDPGALALVGLVDGDLWEEIMTSCLVVACLILGARARSPVQFRVLVGRPDNSANSSLWDWSCHCL